MAGVLKAFKQKFEFENNTVISNIVDERSKVDLNILFIIESCFGLASFGSRSQKNLHRIQKVMLFVIILLTVYSISLNIYFIIRTGLSSTPFSRMTYNLLAMKILWDAEKIGQKFDDFLNKLLDRSDEKCSVSIKRLQYVYLTVVLAVCLINLIQFIKAISSVDSDYEIIIHGIKNITRNQCLIFFSTFNSTIIFNVMLASSFHYILVQFVLKVYASKCKIDFPVLIQRGQFESVKKECRFFNDLRKYSNESLGFTPFSLILLKWSFFVLGITMAFNIKGKINSTSSVIGILYVIGSNTLLLLLVVFLSHETDSHMNDARKEVAFQLTSPSCSGSQADISRLNMYLLHDPIIHATLWHFFEIHPNIILSSYSGMITFSVMVMTTVSSFLY